MAVIPAFGQFAATPNTAQSYLSGAKLAIDQQSDQQRLAVQVQQHAQTIALEQQRLQQQAQLAEMEMAAKQAAQQREELVRQQQNEIENQYKQSMIGLKQRELEQDQQKLTAAATAAARQFSAKQKYESLIASGVPAEKALLQVGPEMGIPGGAYSAALQAQRGPMDLGGAAPIAGLPPEFTGVRTGPNSRQVIKLPNTTGTSTSLERSKISALSKEASDLAKSLATVDPIRLKKFPEEVEADRQRLRKIRSALDTATGLGDATLPKSLTPASTNRIGRFNVISDAAVSR